MKVYYHSALNDTELTPGGVLRTVPCKAYLELHKEKTESPCELLYNGTLIDPDTKEIECNEEAELVVRRNGERDVYTVRPLIQPLSVKYARAYEQFSYEYRDMEFDEISSIQLGGLKLYAVDQSTEVHDYTEVFDQIGIAFSAFKAICEKPKSHLKAVNEVRPIETVKRIGYESIPYLAAHSEDWLARTASGLKPARLFSRVEDDEYQIYENRVVKTLIDLILGFLRKTEKQLRDQRDQLRGIMNSSVQTGSFGFDVSFQKAVSELMSSDDKGDEYRSRSLELVEKLQARAYFLLKRYRTLRQTRLYRYLKKSKPVSNPLNETNILVMDKYYSVIFKLWKTIHHVVAPKTMEEESQIAFDDTCDDYRQFCATLCGYAAHVLGFELLENGHYERTADHIDLTVSSTDNGLVHISLKDTATRMLTVPSNIDVPIAAGTSKGRISYDGYSLIWPNDITVDEIDAFCSLFKTRESRGKEQSEEKRKYAALKSLLDQAERSYDKPGKKEFVIIPVAVELGAENRTSFKDAMEGVAQKYLAEDPDTEIIAAIPVCNETEQKIAEYAKEEGQCISLLPLTMFDINSFRRLQNMLYRQILKLEKDSCPNCGGTLRKHDNQRICDTCNQLTLTKTICPNPECRHEYVYMGYDVPIATLEKMQRVQRDNFFEWDSLYQYKDIVNMTVASGKIRTICPCCHQS
ncbi:MAG: hypothetical protein ACI4FO_02425 [Acutalibacteraceae bacterium]